jgi:hypothetical protein
VGNEYASNNLVTFVAMQRRCKHAFPTIERPCFVRGPWKVVIKKNSVEKSYSSFEPSLPVYELGTRGIELNWTESSLRNWKLQNNGKQGMRLCKENFMRDLKWEWDWYKSVARIRLVKTENSSVCVMVNCKVCGNSVSPLIACIPEYCVQDVNKSNRPNQSSVLYSRNNP